MRHVYQSKSKPFYIPDDTKIDAIIRNASDRVGENLLKLREFKGNLLSFRGSTMLPRLCGFQILDKPAIGKELKDIIIGKAASLLFSLHALTLP